MSDKPVVPDAEYGVVCVDCRSINDPQVVMKSAWYRQGMTPPCQFCGGKTIEIALSDYEQFVADSRRGKFFG